jgi:hypothetical protein
MKTIKDNLPTIAVLTWFAIIITFAFIVTK